MVDRDLVAAVKRTDVKSVMLLLERGANPNTDVDDAEIHSARALLHFVLRYFRNPSESKLPHTSLLIYVLQHARDGKRAANLDGPECIAALLLSRGANANCYDVNGVSAFRYATLLKFDPVQSLLIDEGLDCNRSSPSGTTPLMMVHSAHIARLLLRRGALVESVDSEGWTALTYAVADVDPDRVRLILNYQTEPAKAQKSGYNLLYLVADGVRKQLDHHWKWDTSCPETRKLNSDAIRVAAILIKAGFGLPRAGDTVDDGLRTDGVHVDDRGAIFLRYIHRCERASKALAPILHVRPAPM